MKLRTPLAAAAVAAMLSALPSASGAHPEPSQNPSAPRPAEKKKKRASDSERRTQEKQGKKGKKGNSQQVSLRFKAVAGDEPVACGKIIEGLGKPATSARLVDFRFFVSDVRLVRANGSSVPVRYRNKPPFRAVDGKDRTTLIDLENGTSGCEDATPEINSAVRGTVPRDKYVGVQFEVGVPFSQNHTDMSSSTAPLNSAAMGWSWQTGRKFTKIEVGDPNPAVPTWKAPTFFIHLGSAGCKGNPATGDTVECGFENRASIKLKRFNVQTQSVAVDVKELLGDEDITVNRANAPGCMSGPTDPECDSVFRSLGLDWKADGSGSGQPSGKKQTAFRALRRDR